MIDQAVAARNVHDILDTLRCFNVPAWIQDGSLLGLVRDGDFLRWDHDADTGCFYKDWNYLAEEALQAKGFECVKKLGSEDNGWQHRWSRNGVKVDIFFYYDDPDGRIWHAAYLGEKVQYRYHYQRFGIAPIQTPRGTYMAPDPPEYFLGTKYGDWKIVKRKWHFANGPINHTRMS